MFTNTPGPQHAISINWKALFDCAGIMNAVFLVLGGLGLWYGMKGDKRARRAEENERTAQEAARRATQQLLARRASEELNAISLEANELSVAVNSGHWRVVSQKLPGLLGRLAQANGSFAPLIKRLSMDEQVEVAANALRGISLKIPAEAGELAPEAHNGMKEQCVFVATVLNELYGKMKYRDPEGDS